MKQLNIKEYADVRGEKRFVVDLRKFGKGGGRKFFKTITEAEEFRDDKLGEFKMFHAQFALLDDAVKYDLLRAHEKMDGKNASVLDAVEFYLGNFKSVESVALNTAIADFLEAKKLSGKRPRYVTELRYGLNNFKEHMDKHHHGIKCDGIESKHIEKWIHNGNGWSNRTKHGKLIDLSTFFSFALKKKWVTAIPTDDVEAIKIEQKPICILPVEDCRKLMKAALDILEEEKAKPEPKSSAIAYLTLTLFCGIRPEEALRLTWDNIDLEKGFVRIEGHVSKTRKRRLVTIQPNAKKWLELVKGHDKTMPLSSWKDRLKVVRAKAGIPWGHDICRHTAASMMFATVGAAATSRELGHSEQVLFTNYRELVTPDEAKAFWSIEP